MVSKEQVDELIEKTDIVGLVSEYVSLEKSGAGFKGLCPFHNENTPSFMVSPSKKIAKCMGCGGGGSPISFLMKIKNISYPEALRELADRAGMKLDGLDSPRKKENNNDHLYKIMKEASKFYIYNLFNSKTGLEALEYLHKRGLDDDTIKKFEIGLSPSSSDSLYKVLKEQSFTEIDMIHLGLVKNGDRGFYDLFQRRIMFPIKDEAGNVIAFSGRIFNTTDTNQPKYVNSPETVIFKKSHTLYHLYDGLSQIRRLHRIVLHEGQMDVIASAKAGIEEAVCSMGTALTVDQVKIMKKYTDQIIVCYDGDEAGLNAMKKAYNLLFSQGVSFKFVILPDKKDPDEFVKLYGKDAYLEYFNNNTIDPLDFIIEYAGHNKNFNSMSDMDSAKKIVFEALLPYNSQMLVERYLNILSKKINISPSSLLIDYKNYNNSINPQVYNDDPYINTSSNEEVAPKLNSIKLLSSIDRAQMRLFNYAKISKDYAYKIDDSGEEGLPFINFLEPGLQSLWMALVDDYYIQYKTFNEGLFLKGLDNNLHNKYVDILRTLMENSDMHNDYNEKDLDECIKTVIYSKPKRDIDNINKKFNSLSDSDKLKEVSLKFEKLKKLNKSKINQK